MRWAILIMILLGAELALSVSDHNPYIGPQIIRMKRAVMTTVCPPSNASTVCHILVTLLT